MDLENEMPEVKEPEAPKIGTLSMWQVWWRAITRPKVETYHQIRLDPAASRDRGYRFIVLGTLISYGISLLSFLFIEPLYGEQFGVLGSAEIGIAIGIYLICAVPLGLAIWFLMIALGVTITNWTARLLGGEGNYGELLYLTSAWIGPLMMLSGAIGLLYNAGTSVIADPIFGGLVACLILPVIFGLYLYGAASEVIAVRASHRLSWGRSFVAILPVVAILVGLIVLAVVLVLALFFWVASETFGGPAYWNTVFT